MTQVNAREALQGYRKGGLEEIVEGADPHRLIQMLLQGALDRIAAARGFMERGDVAQKGTHIGKAISIVEGLRVSLDREKGGDIADNLERLYEYLETRLLEANVRNEPAYLDEAAGLIREIKTAWDAIPAELAAGAASEAGGA